MRVVYRRQRSADTIIGMNGPTLKVAIIGAGVMGQQHARSWTHVPYATVTTICDFNLDAANKLATEFHAAATASIDSVLASDVDVVSVFLVDVVVDLYVLEMILCIYHPI